MKSQVPTLVSWSSGKDSAWALQVLQQTDEYKIAGLLTTLNGVFDPVAMHSTRRGVLEAQAAAADLPLQVIPLPWPCSNQEYEAAMHRACAAAIASSVEAIAFGDLFLGDIRRYREDRLRGSGLTSLFPIWGLETRGLIREMIGSGVKARIVCVDPKKMPGELAGCDVDEALLRALPARIDRAAKTASSTPASTTGQCFMKQYQSKMERWSSARVLSLPTSDL
jgi:diphthamide synthase (EF-2-diphthine--ammonia ligase)